LHFAGRDSRFVSDSENHIYPRKTTINIRTIIHHFSIGTLDVAGKHMVF